MTGQGGEDGGGAEKPNKLTSLPQAKRFQAEEIVLPMKATVEGGNLVFHYRVQVNRAGGSVLCTSLQKGLRFVPLAQRNRQFHRGGACRGNRNAIYFTSAKKYG